MARYSYQKEQKKFIDEAMIKLPAEWAKKARKKWHEIAKGSVKDANTYLLDLMDAIDCAIDIGASDDDLINLSVQIVNRIRIMKSEHLTRQGKSLIQSQNEFYEALELLCVEYGVRYPHEHDRGQALARLTDAGFWLRRLRIVHAKQAEGAAIDAGMVHRKAALYVSDDTVKRRNDALKRNAETLENVNLMNVDTGEIIKLSQAAAAGMANPYNRASELITRTKGFQELSEKYKHHCVFLTITCPSRMHAVRVTREGVAVNPKYDGTKPDEAQKYLVRCWARVRAKLARDGVKFYGLRVVEPHHDGCPHWHASIWYKNKSDIHAIRRAVKEHFLRGSECDYKERGAALNRLKFKICDARGAVGYMLKYILKNMKGLGIDGENSDEGNISSEAGAGRVEAWAATWRIRQFQQVGGHSVTVWRELRRVDEGSVLPKFYEVWKSAQKIADKRADYAAFIESMGGLETKPKDAIFKVDYDFINGRGKYGETIIKKVLGVAGSWVYDFGLRTETIKTNRSEWVVM